MKTLTFEEVTEVRRRYSHSIAKQPETEDEYFYRLLTEAEERKGVRDRVVIPLGYGKYGVHSGHLSEVPALIFSTNKAGPVPVGTELPSERYLEADEELVTVTFANVEALNVVEGKIKKVRETYFPESVAPTPDRKASVLQDRLLEVWHQVYDDCKKNNWGPIPSSECATRTVTDLSAAVDRAFEKGE